MQQQRVFTRACAAGAVVVLLALAAAPAAATVGRVVASANVNGHPIVVYWDETNTARKLTLQVRAAGPE
jgi:hypothetical protein